MRKVIVSLATLLGITLLAVTGCSKPQGVDTAKAESAFQSASGSEKSNFDQAVSAAKAGDYAGAVAALQKVAASAKLTPEQKVALEDLMTQVKAKVSEMAGKAADTAGKAVEDASKSATKAADDMQKKLKQ